VIILLLFLVLPFVLAYWVYTDASSRGDDKATMWALLTGLLTVLTGIGGFVVLLVYVLQRE
jgi:uncharacterized membrane protein YfcA